MNRSRGANVAADVAATFAADTAVRTGASERAVREDVQIAGSIPDDVRDAIRDAPIAGHNEARSARGPTGPGSRRAGPLREAQAQSGSSSPSSA